MDKLSCPGLPPPGILLNDTRDGSGIRDSRWLSKRIACANRETRPKVVIGSDEKSILTYVACVCRGKQHGSRFAVRGASVEQAWREASAYRCVPVIGRQCAERSLRIARSRNNAAINVEQMKE